ncbi:MAG: HAD-IIB family hydrolase [Gammaproteobacteria bacterium]
MNTADIRPAHRLFVCTDLDRTLLPNGVEPEAPRARERFSRLTARPEVTLAYVTGRHRELVEEALDTFALPLPDYVIGNVGTSIYSVRRDGDWRMLTAWQEAIAPDWNGVTRKELERLLRGIGELELQPDEKQNRFKLSYYVPIAADRLGLDTAISERLLRRGVRARIVHSTDELAGVGLLDILPQRASKLHAIEYLMDTLGFDIGETVFSGDSGNDLEVLVSPIPAVLVANAVDEVREAATTAAAEKGISERLYLARGGFLDMNGNYAAGILEGIAHFHPHVAAWIEENDATDTKA